jgi:hypothetical protein
MGEDLLDFIGRAPPRGGDRRSVAKVVRLGFWAVDRAGQFKEAAEEARGRSPARQKASFTVVDKKRHAVPQGPGRLDWPRRKSLGLGDGARTAFTQRARFATRRRRTAGRRAEVHERLSHIPGSPPMTEEKRRFGKAGLVFAIGAFESEEAREHPPNIPVDRQDPATEGDRRDGVRRVFADTGQTFKQLGNGRKNAAVGRDATRASVEVAGAAVVSKAREGVDDLCLFRGRERMDARPSRQEFFVIGSGCRHGRLLQQNFGEPDSVGIRGLARFGAPGQRTSVAIPPGEQAFECARRPGLQFLPLPVYEAPVHNKPRKCTAMSRQDRIPPADSIGALATKQLSKLFAGRAVDERTLLFAWKEIVGQRIAESTRPVGLKWPPRAEKSNADVAAPATLIVRVDSAQAMDVQFALPRMIEAINAHVGWKCVGQIALRQERFAPQARPAGRRRDVIRDGAVREAVRTIEDEPLRESLFRLGVALSADAGDRETK